MKVNIQMFLPGSGKLQLQLQSAHGYDDRAGEPSCSRQITVHPLILRHHMPFKAHSPTGATKTSQPWEEAAA